MATVFLVAVLMIGVAAIVDDQPANREATLEVCLVCGRLKTEEHSGDCEHE